MWIPWRLKEIEQFYNDSAISAIFVLRFKNEAYSVNIMILANTSMKVAVYLPTLPFPTIA